jgi:plasmid stability protein
VKNITVSVPDEVYRRARVRAAEQGRSLSAIVAEFLENLEAREAKSARLRRERDDIIAGIKNFKAGDRLSREAVHDRDALR